MAQMKPMERLVTRISQVLKSNPGKAVTISIAADQDGQPSGWSILGYLSLEEQKARRLTTAEIQSGVSQELIRVEGRSE